MIDDPTIPIQTDRGYLIFLRVVTLILEHVQLFDDQTNEILRERAESFIVGYITKTAYALPGIVRLMS